MAGPDKLQGNGAIPAVTPAATPFPSVENTVPATTDLARAAARGAAAAQSLRGMGAGATAPVLGSRWGVDSAPLSWRHACEALARMPEPEFRDMSANAGPARVELFSGVESAARERLCGR